MVSWGKRNGLNVKLLESYVQKGGTWQDFVAIFIKDDMHASKYINRILNAKQDFENGLIDNCTDFLNPSSTCQNDKKLLAINKIVSEQIFIS
jgi:hypothetical protein